MLSRKDQKRFLEDVAFELPGRGGERGGIPIRGSPVRDTRKAQVGELCGGWLEETRPMSHKLPLLFFVLAPFCFL